MYLLVLFERWSRGCGRLCCIISQHCYGFLVLVLCCEGESVCACGACMCAAFRSSDVIGINILCAVFTSERRRAGSHPTLELKRFVDLTIRSGAPSWETGPFCVVLAGAHPYVGTGDFC